MEKDQKQGHRLNLSVNALWGGGKGLLSHNVGSRLEGFWEVFRLPGPQPSSCHNPTLSATPHLQKNPSRLSRITLWDVPPYSCALEEYLLCSHLSFLSFIFSFFERIGFSSKPRKKETWDRVWLLHTNSLLDTSQRQYCRICNLLLNLCRLWMCQYLRQAAHGLTSHLNSELNKSKLAHCQLRNTKATRSDQQKWQHRPCFFW